MSSIKDEYRDLLETMEKQRDELQLQMHLARTELRDEWIELEKKWEQLKQRGDQIRREANATGKEVNEAFQIMADEIKDGYKRIKNLL